MAAELDLDPRLERYAELAVRVGTSLRPGQTVFVDSPVEHAPLARAVARAAYAGGARYVDVLYHDPHVQRALIELGPDEALEHSPAWQVQRMRAAGGNVAVGTVGDAEPELLADLDGGRVGRARMREVQEAVMQLLVDRAFSWTGLAYPVAGWAEQVFGEPDVERLWEAVAFCTRLDEPDPVQAWQEHVGRLDRRAQALNALDVDRLHFRGPGTDLTVGLMPATRFMAALFETAEGIRYVPNIPTEEVFAAPDARRTEGTVAATKPLALAGQVVRGLRVEFEDGRISKVEADEGAALVRGQLDSDEQASRLGEVALVDGSSRVGKTGLTFFNTLYDENATCHIAYGMTVPGTYTEDAEPEGLNGASVHTDFMIGGPEVDVDAVTRDGRTVPLLREDVWQLPE